MMMMRKGPEQGVPEDFNVPVGDLLRGERARLGRSLLDVQRDLRIKAAHVAAIEDMNPAGFANRGVIPGYVRSYARYLELEPEQVYRLFCAQTGFSSATFGATPMKGKGDTAIGGFHTRSPLGPKRGSGFSFPAVPVSAIGSLLALAAVVGGLGYGGWTVVRNIQRVQFTPVEELPVAVAEINELAPPAATGAVAPELADLASPVAATALADLYRDQEASVPILSPRDGPIAAIDPESRGAPLELARSPALDTAIATVPASGPGVRAAEASAVAAIVAAGQQVAPVPGGQATPVASDPAPLASAPLDSATPATPAPPPPADSLMVVAERAAWIRVYLANGTVLFERILEKGETYSPPVGLTEPRIWAGNSGSVYVRVGETLRGPLGSGTRAARDVPLIPAALAERYPAVDHVPEVVSQSLDAEAVPGVVPAVAIQ